MYNPSLHFHFTGIGGSGMSGLAEILLNLGFKVSGSDLKLSPTCERLRKLGAVIFEGHDASHVPASSSLLVYSSAVDAANPEMIEARERGIPIVRRAEVLAELMRLKFGVGVAGSHGKTTTTSMTAAILERGGLDPTVVIGGLVKSLGTGGKLGKSNYLVAETDESDRSFLLLKPTIAVVTNIDAEHLNAYASLTDLEDSFEQFVSSVPFYGLAILCIDDARVRKLAEKYSRRKLTYGFAPDARLRADNLEFSATKTSFEVIFDGNSLGRFDLPMLGKHLVQNSLAAIAIGIEFGLSPDLIRTALADFAGVKRRLEVVGQCSGITVMSDYGHHPAEIRATLQAVRSGFGSSLRRFHVIFQPHRFTRTRDCFNEFTEAFTECDNLVVTDIYAAGESPIEGITGRKLCDATQRPSARFVEKLEDIPEGLGKDLKPGDVVLCLGAGSIGAFAERLPEDLSRFIG